MPVISSSARAVIKRLLDTTLIVITSPLLFVLMVVSAVAVRVSMGSPVFFTQSRIGMGEQTFRLLKFRTMSNARDAEGVLLPDGARLTRTGRVLRKLSLDELPQLINVLRGEMSLIGPRPLLVQYLPHYTMRERARHSVRPGLTGAAQVAGRNGLLWDDRLELDAHYALYGTLADDVRIFWATVRGLVTREGVSVIAGESGEPLHIARGYPRCAGYTMRRLELADVKTRVAWFLDERTRLTMNVPDGVTVESTEAWLKRTRQDAQRSDFVLIDIERGARCAMMGVRRSDNAALSEVYVLVDPTRHGEGIGTSAMTVLLQHLRSLSNTEGVWLTVAPDNNAAVRLYERQGFQAVSRDEDGVRIRMELRWRGDE